MDIKAQSKTSVVETTTTAVDVSGIENALRNLILDGLRHNGLDIAQDAELRFDVPIDLWRVEELIVVQKKTITNS